MPDPDAVRRRTQAPRRTVLLVGARGATASALAVAFADAGWIVSRESRRVEAAAFTDADVLVDAAPNRRLGLEREVLRGGGRLVVPWHVPDARLTRVRNEVTPPRGLVVVNAGLLPGVTSVLAAKLLAAHPHADAVEVAATFTVSDAGLTRVAAGRTVRLHAPGRRAGVLPQGRRTGRVAASVMVRRDDVTLATAIVRRSGGYHQAVAAAVAAFAGKLAESSTQAAGCREPAEFINLERLTPALRDLGLEILTQQTEPAAEEPCPPYFLDENGRVHILA